MTPTTSAAPSTTSTTPPSSDATTTTSQPAIETLSCSTNGAAIETFVTEFTETMALARESGRLDVIDDCVDTVPAVYDAAAPPNCWAPCPPASRTFHVEHATSGQATNVEGDTWWSARLPVTYRTDDFLIDVIENWQTSSVDDRFVVHDFDIEEPVADRQASAEVIADYFGHIANANWGEAADLITRTASAPFDEREDLQLLGATSYDTDDIAAALARWCADGCDTTRPTAQELTFTGSYELTRNDQTVRAALYEGTYGIFGPPILPGIRS
jgi:hypothetical protein